MNNYLIPANSKKSLLIFNMFRPIDLGVVIGGALTTLILMLAISNDSITAMVIKLVPLVITLLLVVPLANYHNIMVFIREVYIYLSSQKRFYWRGWCATYGFDEPKKKN